jgi:hypothetical protein
MATAIRVAIAIIVLGVIGLILGIVFAIMSPSMLIPAIGLIVVGAAVAMVGFFIRGMMKAMGGGK